MDQPPRMTPEMIAIVDYLAQNGATQFTHLTNDLLQAEGLRSPTAIDRNRIFHALQQLMSYGIVVQGKDWQNPTWPWLNLSEKGRATLGSGLRGRLGRI